MLVSVWQRKRGRESERASPSTWLLCGDWEPRRDEWAEWWQCVVIDYENIGRPAGLWRAPEARKQRRKQTSSAVVKHQEICGARLESALSGQRLLLNKCHFPSSLNRKSPWAMWHSVVPILGHGGNILQAIGALRMAELCTAQRAHEKCCAAMRILPAPSLRRNTLTQYDTSLSAPFSKCYVQVHPQFLKAPKISTYVLHAIS